MSAFEWYKKFAILSARLIWESFMIDGLKKTFQDKIEIESFCPKTDRFKRLEKIKNKKMNLDI